MEFELNQNDETTRVNVTPGNVTFNKVSRDYEIEFIGADAANIRIGTGTYYIYDIQILDGMISYMHNGNRYQLPYKDEQAILLARMGFKTGSKSGHGLIKSPMPGKIIAIKKQIGDTVNAGDAVVILEAMKMENELKSPVAGTVSTIHVTEGSSVEKNTILLEIK